MPLDHSLFADHMREPNPLTLLLKGHLWIEACLNRGLEVALRVPGALNLDRTPFSTKIDLCVASGAIDAADAQGLRSLNRLRNSVAHNLHAVIDEDTVRTLEASLSGRLRGIYDELRRDRGVTERLRLWLYTVVWALEVTNMSNEYEKVHQAALVALELRRLLAEQSGKTKTSEELASEIGLPPRPEPFDAWINSKPTDESLLRGGVYEEK